MSALTNHLFHQGTFARGTVIELAPSVTFQNCFATKTQFCVHSGCVIAWGCSKPQGLDDLHSEKKTNSSGLYKQIVHENIRVKAKTLHLHRICKWILVALGVFHIQNSSETILNIVSYSDPQSYRYQIVKRTW